MTGFRPACPTRSRPIQPAGNVIHSLSKRAVVVSGIIPESSPVRIYIYTYIYIPSGSPTIYCKGNRASPVEVRSTSFTLFEPHPPDLATNYLIVELSHVCSRRQTKPATPMWGRTPRSGLSIVVCSFGVEYRPSWVDPSVLHGTE